MERSPWVPVAVVLTVGILFGVLSTGLVPAWVVAVWGVGTGAFLAVVRTLGHRLVGADSDGETSAPDENAAGVGAGGDDDPTDPVDATLALDTEARAVSDTGVRREGRPVYETTVDDRRVTAELDHTSAGPAVRVATPMRATRPGVGFSVHRRAGRLRTVGDGPDTAACEGVVDDVRSALWGLDSVGRLVVDDRLGTVQHYVTDLTDAETFRRQAEHVVEAARTVERHVEQSSTDGGRPGPAVDVDRSEEHRTGPEFEGECERE